MASFDIFNNDAFAVTQLSATMVDLPSLPGRIDKMGLFQEEGINTTAFYIEKRGSTLSLVPASPRGGVAPVMDRENSQMIAFPTVHLRKTDTIRADEVQNLRAFGSESELQSVQTLVNRQLARLKQQLDLTLEYQRIGAIKGQVLDSDGTTVLMNAFAQFGVAQQTLDMDLDTNGTDVKAKTLAATRLVDDELGGIGASGYRVLCSRGFFDALLAHPSVKAAWAAYRDGEFLRAGQPTSFYHAGVYWEEYKGKVGAINFIADGDAYMIPEGVPGLFIGRYAPADYMETVNTNGLPYYGRQEVMRMNRGVELEGQSNPMFLCTRPRAVIRLFT